MSQPESIVTAIAPWLPIFVVCGEGLQYFSPTRVSKIEDIFYNLIGIALATALFCIFKKTLSPEKAAGNFQA